MKKGMKYQYQFDTPSDINRRVRTAVRDSFFHMLIWILSLMAIGGIAWLQVNGENVDYKINHWMK